MGNILGFGWGYCPLGRVRRKDGERESAQMSFGAMYAAVPTEPRVVGHTFQSILTDIDWMWSAAIQCYPFSGRRGFIYAGNRLLHGVEFGFIGAGMLVRCKQWNRCNRNPGMGSWHGSRPAVDHLHHWMAMMKSPSTNGSSYFFGIGAKLQKRAPMACDGRMTTAYCNTSLRWRMNDTWTTISVIKST